MSYTTGTYILVGAALPVSAEAAANQVVTFNLAGIVDSFAIRADAGSTVTINQTVNVADTLNLAAAGGTIVLGSTISALDAVNATLTGGGQLIAGGTLANLLTAGTVTFGAGGGTYLLGTPGTLLSISLGQSINGFTSSADIIDDQSLQYSAITSYSITGSATGTQTITVSGSGGNFVYTTSNAGLANGTYASLQGGPLTLANDGAGGTLISVCFLGGTMIATPAGEVAVEMLRAGDLVNVVQDGTVVPLPVKWVGGRMIRAADYDYCDEAFPVRVRAGAFADGVPHRDLLVTPEHCLLTEAGLVPARMLVNGASILIDRSIPDYAFHHVELDRHGILIAEGLATESYLDTGNRGVFHESGGSIAVRDGLEMAASLAVERDAVEPIWTTLAERARRLGLQPAEDAFTLSGNPDLRVLLDDDRELRACLHDSRHHMFHIPRGTRPVRLLSRTARPSDVIGPFIDDRRTLGVSVDSLTLWDGLDSRVIPATGIALPGWHTLEGRTRWTTGEAALDLPVAGEECFLDVLVAGTLPYRVAAIASS